MFTALKPGIRSLAPLIMLSANFKPKRTAAASHGFQHGFLGEFGPIGSIEAFDPPTRKPYPRAKHEADRMNRCRDMAVRSFQNARSVGRSLLGPQYYIVLMYSSSLR